MKRKYKTLRVSLLLLMLCVSMLVFSTAVTNKKAEQINKQLIALENEHQIEVETLTENLKSAVYTANRTTQELKILKEENIELKKAMR